MANNNDVRNGRCSDWYARSMEAMEAEDARLLASDEEIDEWIEDYRFRLPEEDPENGGIVCDYFPDIVEDKELQERLLYNTHRIREELIRRFHEEQEHDARTAALRRIK